MPDRWAVATGNWSSTATWNGGTLPGSGDDVFADGFTVTIDQNVTVLSIRTTARSGGTAGGGFSMSGSRTVTADLIAGTTVCLTISTSLIATINGSVTGGSSSTAYGVSLTGVSARCNITGALTASTGSAINIARDSAGCIYNGNVAGGSNAAIINISTGSLTVLGNVTGGSAANSHGVSQVTSVANIFVVGTVTGGTNSSANGINIANFASLIVLGDVTGGSVGNGVRLAAATAYATSVMIYGTVTGGSTSGIGVLNAGGHRVEIYGSTVDSGGSATSNSGGGSINVTAVGGGGGGSLAFNPVVRLP